MMGLDWISIALGVIVVLIFMAIFTLLRTMTSPFIKRFETYVGQPMTKLQTPSNAHGIAFSFKGRNCRLMEVVYQKQAGDQTTSKNYIFLEVETKSDLMIRFRNIMQNLNVDRMFQMLLDVNHELKGSEVFVGDLSDFFKEIKVNTSNPLKAKVFLSSPQVLNILHEIKSKSGAYGLFEVVPLMIEPGRLILDYRLSETLTNQLVYDPRHIKKHVMLLDQLAAVLESI